MNAPQAWIALGSNLGDRRSHLEAALRDLQREAGPLGVVSSLYATDPVGMPGAPEFLNAVAGIWSRLTPEELLATCLRIEGRRGRVRSGQLSSRPIDLDLLLYGEERRSGERLTLPHPRMGERAFVLLPLAQIAPDLTWDGASAADRAQRADASGVRRLPDVPGWPPA